MTLGFDDATATAMSAVAEVQINSGNSLTAPDIANTLVEVVPYFSSSAAFTTVEPVLMAARLQSDDIAVEPKRFSLNAIDSFPALASWVNSPSLTSYAMNIDLSRSKSARINYFGQGQTDQTVEPLIGMTVVYDTNTVRMPEQFYQKPDNETATGTTLGTRASGDDITITGGREINYLATQATLNAAMTASESLFGFSEFASSDFLTSMPYRLAITPHNVGIGATGDLALSGQTQGLDTWKFPIGNGIPIAGRTVINSFFTNRAALTSAGIFLNSVGYIK